jgi:hypothetical protein
MFPCRAIFRTAFACSVAITTCASGIGAAQSSVKRLNLPQLTASVPLAEPIRKELGPALAAAAHSSRPGLPSRLGFLLLGSLPVEFQTGCDDMLSSWGSDAKGTARWKVRLLSVSARPEGHTAVLAFRCSAALQGASEVYDERLAVLSLENGKGTLGLIPLAKDCNNCSNLYQINYSQMFAVEGAPLAELRVSYSTDNPCCDGGGQERAEQLVFLLLPEGKPVLSVDQSHEWISPDDENGDWEKTCEAKVNSTRDVAGNLSTVSTKTRCTEDKKPVPGVTRQTYRWNAATRRFEEVKRASR